MEILRNQETINGFTDKDVHFDLIFVIIGYSKIIQMSYEIETFTHIIIGHYLTFI